MATTGSVTTQYAYGPDARLGQEDASGIRVFLTDLHGNEALIVNGSTTAKGTLAYDPWGGKSSTIGTDATNTPFGYQADPTDPLTGLVDMGARNYDPAEGRFTTQDTMFGDTLDPNTLNQYAYANDSPLVFGDPDGHKAEGCDQNYGCGGGTHNGHGSNIGGVVTGDMSGDRGPTHGAPINSNLPGEASTPKPKPAVLPPGWFKSGNQMPFGARGWKPGYYCYAAMRTTPSCMPTPHFPEPSKWEVAGFFAAPIVGTVAVLAAPEEALGLAGASALRLAYTRAPFLLGGGGAAGEVVQSPETEGPVHGNSATSPVTAYLYRLSTQSGQYLKTGITNSPATRYTKTFLADKEMYLLTSGSRRAMLNLERYIVERDPGPLNREPWRGAAEDAP